VNLTVVTTINGTADTGLQISGVIHGYRSIENTQPPQITYQQAPTDHRSFILSWPQGFKLQRSGSLPGASWIDLAQESPTTITPLEGQGYFRAVLK
jgi:hypothetical protein